MNAYRLLFIALPLAIAGNLRGGKMQKGEGSRGGAPPSQENQHGPSPSAPIAEDKDIPSAPSKCGCNRFVMLSTQRSGTTSLSAKFTQHANSWISEATNVGAHGHEPFLSANNQTWRKNSSNFAQELWGWQDKAEHFQDGDCFQQNTDQRCTVGFSLLLEDQSAESMLPLFDLLDKTDQPEMQRPRIVVVQRRDNRKKWFSRERACVTGDWGGHHSIESGIATKAYLEKHGYCCTPFEEYEQKHNQYYAALRPACDAHPESCMWVYTTELRQINNPAAKIWGDIVSFTRLPPETRDHSGDIRQATGKARRKLSNC